MTEKGKNKTKQNSQAFFEGSKIYLAPLKFANEHAVSLLFNPYKKNRKKTMWIPQ